LSASLPKVAAAERLAELSLRLKPENLPKAVRSRAEELLIDIVGLCVAARHTDYIKAAKAAVDPSGKCTAIGHETTYGPDQAALINGMAIHGEDFDDTFEGGPVHSSATVYPAVLAACERFGRDGRAALLGMVAGVEATCRMAMIVPKGVHRSGFHPTSVLGTMGSALGV
jgi:2-methylcitrate dehydratase PrpD